MARTTLHPEGDFGRFGPEDMTNKLGLETFKTDHLPWKARTVADKLNREIFGPHSGIFSGRGCPAYRMSECGKTLQILFDGGDLYDFLSIDGEGEYYGIGIHFRTCDFLSAIGYHNEPYASWRHDVYIY